MKGKLLRTICAAGALLSICAATGCNMEEMSSLKDISRPYVGEYKCRKLQMAGQDELDHFEYIKLDLDYSGKFQVSCQDINGNEDTYDGTYKISEEEATVTLTSNAGGKEQSFVFPYEKGKVIMQLLFNEKLLYAEFSMVE